VYVFVWREKALQILGGQDRGPKLGSGGLVLLDGLKLPFDFISVLKFPFPELTRSGKLVVLRRYA
jgi:hypothetical protein